MADEIKKVITIEVGQATASLQDVKDKTDEASQSFNSLKDYVAGFSDDGRGVQSDDLMREAMKKCKALLAMLYVSFI